MKRTLSIFAVLVLLAAGLSWAATVTNPGGSSSGGGGGLSATAIDTSQELADILTDEIGSGRAVFGSSPTLTTPNLGTPSAVVLTNGTGLPISSGVSGLGTGVGTVLATPSSANLRSAITDETGTGQLVFGSSPTLTTPVLGTPSSINLVNATAMPATGLTGTVAIGNGGTGSTSFTGSRCIESNAGGTALVVAAGACGTGGGSGIAATAIDTSGELAAIVTDETGRGPLVFATGPRVTLENATGMPATGLVGSVPLANGGTNQTSWTSSRCVQVNAGGTALESAGSACGSGGSSSGASGVVQSADGSNGFVSSGCTSLNGRITCPGGFVAGTSSLGVMTLLEGTATGAGASSGEHNCWIDSSDSLLHCFENGAASQATYMTTTNGATMVNKTYSVDATGNYLTLVKTLWYPAAGASGASAAAIWDLPASAAAQASVVALTNTVKAVLDFPNNDDTSAQIVYRLSRFWNSGPVEVLVSWLSTVTSGNVAWSLQTVCTADGETDDAAFNAVDANNTLVDAAKGTARQLNTATLAALTMTGCSPRENLHLKIRRNAGHASDTLAGTASLYGVELTLREQQTTVPQ